MSETSDIGLKITDILAGLDDAVSNNWDELMASFWRGVKVEIIAGES